VLESQQKFVFCLDHICQTGGPWAKCGLQSLNFKPQPAYVFETVVVYTCLQS